MGPARITLTGSHLSGQLGDFEVVDERYSALQQIGRSNIVATHQVEGSTYPTAWTRVIGPSRIAADLLGHDERSYDSAGHRALISHLARWAGRAAPVD